MVDRRMGKIWTQAIENAQIVSGTCGQRYYLGFEEAQTSIWLWLERNLEVPDGVVPGDTLG